MNHAKHLIFPIDSGRRLIIFKKLPKNIPQHVEIGGHKLRVSYSAQVKQCALCLGNHLKHVCPQGSGDGVPRTNTQVQAPHRDNVTSVMQVTIPSRKRMLSAELEDHDETTGKQDGAKDPPHDDNETHSDQEQSIAMDDNTVSTKPLLFSDVSDPFSDTRGAGVPQVQTIPVAEDTIHQHLQSDEYRTEFPELSSSKEHLEPATTSDTIPSSSSTQQGDEHLVLDPASPTMEPPVQPSFAARATAMVSSLLTTRGSASAAPASTPPIKGTVKQEKKKIKQETVPRPPRPLRTSTQRDKKGGTPV